MNMLLAHKVYKFFTLKAVDRKGKIGKTTLKEKIKWLREGAPLRDEKVVQRFCELKKSQSRDAHLVKIYKT
jgi:hypothetical protein